MPLLDPRRSSALELGVALFIVIVLAAVAVPAWTDDSARARWDANLTSVADLKQAIRQCLEHSSGAPDCDTEEKLRTQGFVRDDYLLPVPPYADGPVAIAAGSASIVIRGDAAAGSCVVRLQPVQSPDGAVLWDTTNEAGCSRARTGVGN